MSSLDRITRDPAVMAGKAGVRGMRVTVSGDFWRSGEVRVRACAANHETLANHLLHSNYPDKKGTKKLRE